MVVTGFFIKCIALVDVWSDHFIKVTQYVDVCAFVRKPLVPEGEVGNKTKGSQWC